MKLVPVVSLLLTLWVSDLGAQQCSPTTTQASCAPAAEPEIEPFAAIPASEYCPSDLVEQAPPCIRDNPTRCWCVRGVRYCGECDEECYDVPDGFRFDNNCYCKDGIFNCLHFVDSKSFDEAVRKATNDTKGFMSATGDYIKDECPGLRDGNEDSCGCFCDFDKKVCRDCNCLRTPNTEPIRCGTYCKDGQLITEVCDPYIEDLGRERVPGGCYYREDRLTCESFGMVDVADQFFEKRVNSDFIVTDAQGIQAQAIPQGRMVAVNDIPINRGPWGPIGPIGPDPRDPNTWNCPAGYKRYRVPCACYCVFPGAVLCECCWCPTWYYQPRVPCGTYCRYGALIVEKCDPQCLDGRQDYIIRPFRCGCWNGKWICNWGPRLIRNWDVAVATVEAKFDGTLVALPLTPYVPDPWPVCVSSTYEQLMTRCSCDCVDQNQQVCRVCPRQFNPYSI